MKLINCDYCQKKIHIGDSIFISSTFLTNGSPDKLHGLKGVDITYYGNLSQAVLCWNWNCISKLIYDLSPNSRTDSWYIRFTNTNSRIIMMGGFITYKHEWILVKEAKQITKTMIKVQSTLIVYRFVYKWMIKRLGHLRRKNWLLYWSLTPFGWQTQEMLTNYLKFTKTKVLKLKKTASCPNLGIETYQDINNLRLLDLS